MGELLIHKRELCEKKAFARFVFRSKKSLSEKGGKCKTKKDILLIFSKHLVNGDSVSCIAT